VAAALLVFVDCQMSRDVEHIEPGLASNDRAANHASQAFRFYVLLDYQYGHEATFASGRMNYKHLKGFRTCT
jgi:hypothetical protein